jgi:hypothetical protein
LEPGEGLVLRPEWSIHTFFMRFPIDVVFVDADQVVVKIVPDLRPWRTAVCKEAHEVVELAAGECERRGLHAGDRLAWAARPKQPPISLVADAASVKQREAADDRKTRVVIGTGDDQFLRLARFLLMRNRFDVEGTKRIAKTVDLVARQGADIVVIDATGSLGEAARTVAAIEALHPDVRVVVGGDGGPPRWTTGHNVTV